MRIRTVKPAYFANEQLAEVHPLGRILFVGLWCLADREGRLADRPRRIKAQVLPYDDIDVEALLTQLEQRGFIIRYAAAGERWIAVPGFRRHQRITGSEAESVSAIPAPPEQQQGTQEEAPAQPSGNSEEAPRTTGREGKGEEGRESARSPDGSTEETPAKRRRLLVEALSRELLDTSDRAVNEWETVCRKAGIKDYDEAVAFVRFAVAQARRSGVAVSYARHVIDLAPAWREWARARHWRQPEEGAA